MDEAAQWRTGADCRRHEKHHLAQVRVAGWNPVFPSISRGGWHFSQPKALAVTGLIVTREESLGFQGQVLRVKVAFEERKGLVSLEEGDSDVRAGVDVHRLLLCAERVPEG